MSDPATVQAVVAFLAERGLSPRGESGGDIVFELRGWPCMIRLDAEDPGFVRLVMPICDLDDPRQATVVATIASEVCAEVKAAKILMLGNRVVADVGLFCDPPDRFQPVFDRMLHSAALAARGFTQRFSAWRDRLKDG